MLLRARGIVFVYADGDQTEHALYRPPSTNRRIQTWTSGPPLPVANPTPSRLQTSTKRYDRDRDIKEPSGTGKR